VTGHVTGAVTPTAGDSESKRAARNAGRGGIAVLGAKIFFVLSGLIQQVLLPKVIGLAGYGALSRVLALANIPNNVVVASSTQGVSRAVARARGAEREAFRATMRVHIPLALGLAGAFAALAPALATFEQAPYIAAPLTLVAVVLFMYGVYAPIIGLLNGRAQFTRQASLDVTFAVLRTCGLLAFGFWFVRRGSSGVLGATLGFALAATLIVPIALVYAGSLRSGPRPGAANLPALPSARAYVGELLPLAGAQFFTSAVMQVDISLLGRFLSRGAAAAGQPGATADEWVAVYRACQLFAFLPYQLLLSVTQILFPMVARAKAEGDDAAVRRYVEQGARVAAIACGMMVTVIATLPGTLLAFAYGTVVGERGASTLRVLALGQGAFTMLAIATTVLASIGRERVAALITAGALATVSGACAALASGAPFGAAQLTMTATATTLALMVTLLIAARAVHKLTGGFVPIVTAVRVAGAVAVVVLTGTLLPHFSRLLAPVAALGVGALYVALLVATRELTKADASVLRALRS
jgi:stage V sporulation protein B